MVGVLLQGARSPSSPHALPSTALPMREVSYENHLDLAFTSRQALLRLGILFHDLQSQSESVGAVCVSTYCTLQYLVMGGIMPLLQYSGRVSSLG